MAFIHGKGTAVTLDAVDLSAFSNSVEWTESTDSHDVTTFGKNSHVKQGGLNDGSGTIEGVYDDTASTGPAAAVRPLKGTVVDLVYQPEGAGTGLPQRTVPVLVQEYSETAPVANMITFSIALEFSGDVDDTAQA